MEPQPLSAGYGRQVRLSDISFTYVYILRCNNGKSYVGHTSDLTERLLRHQKGYVPSTRTMLPVEMVTYIAFTDQYRAIEFEKYLKSGSGRAFMNKRLT